ncbi:hypothetical protein SNEBB_002104 [Seison nebaliae]|nr:hypothetical protein SNEBB_002104 [Seison nebaliae]
MQCVYKTIKTPTVVNSSCWMKPMETDKEYLVTSCTNYLNFYFVEKDKLILEKSFLFFGHVINMKNIRLQPDRKKEQLVIIFNDAKLSVLELDEDFNQLQTIFSYDFTEDYDLMEGQFQITSIPLMTVSLNYRCICFILFNTKMILISFNDKTTSFLKEEDKMVEVISTSNERKRKLDVDSFGEGEKFENNKKFIFHKQENEIVLRNGEKEEGNELLNDRYLLSAQIDVYDLLWLVTPSIVHVKDVTFLNDYSQPTLMLLGETDQLWNGHLDIMKPKHFSKCYLFSFHKKIRSLTKFYEIPSLPHDSMRCIGHPSNNSGMIFCHNSIILMNSKFELILIQLNSFANINLNKKSFHSIVDHMKEELTLESIEPSCIFDDKLFFMTSDGKSYVICLKTYSVISTLLMIGESVQLSLLTPNGSQLSSCVSNDQKYLFTSSNHSDALLLKISRDCDTMKVDIDENESSWNGEYEAQINYHNNSNDYNEEELWEQLDELWKDETKIKDESDELNDNISLKIVDVLRNVGPISKMCSGESAGVGSGLLKAGRKSLQMTNNGNNFKKMEKEENATNDESIGNEDDEEEDDEIDEMNQLSNVINNEIFPLDMYLSSGYKQTSSVHQIRQSIRPEFISSSNAVAECNDLFTLHLRDNLEDLICLLNGDNEIEEEELKELKELFNEKKRATLKQELLIKKHLQHSLIMFCRTYTSTILRMKDNEMNEVDEKDSLGIDMNQKTIYATSWVCQVDGSWKVLNLQLGQTFIRLIDDVHCVQHVNLIETNNYDNDEMKYGISVHTFFNVEVVRWSMSFPYVFITMNDLFQHFIILKYQHGRLVELIKHPLLSIKENGIVTNFPQSFCTFITENTDDEHPFYLSHRPKNERLNWLLFIDRTGNLIIYLVEDGHLTQMFYINKFILTPKYATDYSSLAINHDLMKNIELPEIHEMCVVFSFDFRRCYLFIRISVDLVIYEIKEQRRNIYRKNDEVKHLNLSHNLTGNFGEHESIEKEDKRLKLNFIKMSSVDATIDQQFIGKCKQMNLETTMSNNHFNLYDELSTLHHLIRELGSERPVIFENLKDYIVNQIEIDLSKLSEKQIKVINHVKLLLNGVKLLCQLSFDLNHHSNYHESNDNQLFEEHQLKELLNELFTKKEQTEIMKFPSIEKQLMKDGLNESMMNDINWKFLGQLIKIRLNCSTKKKRFIFPFDIVNERRGIMVGGKYPIICSLMEKCRLRIHPLWYDAEIQSFAPFNTSNSYEGFIYYTQKKMFRIAVMPNTTKNRLDLHSNFINWKYRINEIDKNSRSLDLKNETKDEENEEEKELHIPNEEEINQLISLDKTMPDMNEMNDEVYLLDYDHQWILRRCFYPNSSVKHLTYSYDLKIFVAIIEVEEELDEFPVLDVDTRVNVILPKLYDINSKSAPRTKRCQQYLIVYESDTWQVIPNSIFKFQKHHKVTSIALTPLTFKGHESGLRTYLTVSTIGNYQEDVFSFGMLHLFDFLDVVPHPDKRFSDLSLKCIYSKEQTGPVTAVNSVVGQLLAGVGQRVFVWTLEERKLIDRAFIDTQIFVSSLSVLKNFIVASDVYKSIYLMKYDESQRTLSILARDFRQLCTSTINFLVDGQYLSFIVCDTNDNLFTYSLSVEHEQTTGLSGQMSESMSTFLLAGFNALVRKGDFNLGQSYPFQTSSATATSSLRVSTLFSHAIPIEKRFHPRQSHNYKRKQLTFIGRVDGGIGCLIPISERIHRRLELLQRVMSIVLSFEGNLYPKKFRKIRKSHVESYNEQRNIIDGDLIGIYLGLDWITKVEIAKRIGSNVEQLHDDLVEMNQSMKKLKRHGNLVVEKLEDRFNLFLFISNIQLKMNYLKICHLKSSMKYVNLHGEIRLPLLPINGNPENLVINKRFDNWEMF